MARKGSVGILGLLALAMLSLVGTGAFLNYVNPRFGWLLVLSAACLVVAVGLARANRPVPRVTWLLLLPLVLVWLVQPRSLGSHMVGAQPPGVDPGAISVFAPLPEDLTPMGLRELNARMHLDANHTVGHRVLLTGFAVPNEQGWELARFAMLCCAADAAANFVQLAAPPAQLAALRKEEWYQVSGVIAPAPVGAATESTTAVLQVESIAPVAAPKDAYEH